jgi:hypothetical protein
MGVAPWRLQAVTVLPMRLNAAHGDAGAGADHGDAGDREAGLISP